MAKCGMALICNVDDYYYETNPIPKKGNLNYVPFLNYISGGAV